MTLIQEKWQQLRANGLDLGDPLSPETAAPDGGGSFTHFQRGSIYWTPETGAREVHGGILNHWVRFGQERGHLGYPVTDETGTPDGNGRFNHFEGGSIYWTPETGAREVHGGVRNQWQSLGWERSFLGYPLTDETSTPDGGGQFNHFQGGTIYWNQQTNNTYVLNLITPLLGQPALVGLDLDGNRFSPRLQLMWDSATLVPDFFLRIQPDIFQQLWGDRLFLRSVSKDQGVPHEIPLKVQALTGEQEIFTASQQTGFARLADGVALRDRTLYDLCFRGTDGVVVVLAPHCVYAKSSWSDFGFIHATDTHVSRRIDTYRQRLVELGLAEGARQLNSYNDSFRDFVTYANYLYDAGALDLILATGDLVDYLFEDDDNRQGPGNFGFFEKLILGASPYPDGRAADELRVPIFMALGNHDYRANPYPLIFVLHVGLGDFVGEIPVIGNVARAINALPGISTLLGWFGRAASPTIGVVFPHYDPLNLTREEAHALVGGLRAQGNIPLYPAYGKNQANKFLKVDQDMLAKSSYYFRWINRDKSYIVRAGQHRFVMLDTGPDVGVVTGAWEALWEKYVQASEDKRTFIGGSPNSEGIELAEVELVKRAQAEARTSGLVVVGLHAPALNIAGNEHAHYFRETEHPTVNRNEVIGFLVRHLPLQIQPGIDPDLFLKHHDWIRTGTRHFKQGSADDLLDDGVSRGKTNDFLLACAGVRLNRKVDLVLAGHKHRSVEFSLSFDSAKQKLLFFHDHYTENPSEYYPSIGIKDNDVRRNRSIYITVEPQAALNLKPVKVLEPGLKPFFLLNVPPFQQSLASANDKADWWHQHRPLVIQTGAIGPLENNQRSDGPAPRTRLSPTFQGFRFISVENNVMSNIRYVRRAEFAVAFDLIRRSYGAVFGRDPGPMEIAVWTKEVKERNLTLDDVVSRHKEFLLTADGAQELRNVITRSYQEAFGREAGESEMADWVREAATRRLGYEEIVSSHIAFLLTEDVAQELIDLIIKSFREVLNRFPGNEELNIWMNETRRSRLTYRQIVGAHKRHKAMGGQ